ncbi:hypothetical protein ACH47X_12290 [Promicromonospora kroppenstedtii]|uniref:Uncharacterized protein n=1 Tax=Promicromonospora kroppenstedtii TaxID=440482 RepID=A0ABW7XJI9_9MICO
MTIALGVLLALGICVHLAGPGAVLAASLPASAGNLGDAIGALAGGHAIDVGGVPAAIVTAAALATVSVAAAVATRSLRPAPAPRAAVPGEPEPAPAP